MSPNTARRERRPWATGFSSIGQIGLARHAIEHVEPGLLGRDCHDLARSAVDGDVAQERRRRHVEIPERVVNELEMPLALASLQVHAHEAFREQVASRTVSAVVVGRRRFNREVHEAEVFVDADLSPDTRRCR